MSYSKLTEKKLEKMNEMKGYSALCESMTAASDGSYGAFFEMKERDAKYLLVVENTSTAARNVKVLAGGGPFASVDLTLELAAKQIGLVQLDSGRFKQMEKNSAVEACLDSSALGKVVLACANADVKVGVLVTVQ
ncbi:MAG: hypothetical protein IJX70_04575 [Clostridia bacterium]|nr:hypothetical protein [Clostridia bacterium]